MLTEEIYDLAMRLLFPFVLQARLAAGATTRVSLLHYLTGVTDLRLVAYENDVSKGRNPFRILLSADQNWSPETRRCGLLRREHRSTGFSQWSATNYSLITT